MINDYLSDACISFSLALSILARKESEKEECHLLKGIIILDNVRRADGQTGRRADGQTFARRINSMKRKQRKKGERYLAKRGISVRRQRQSGRHGNISEGIFRRANEIIDFTPRARTEFAESAERDPGDRERPLKFRV